MTHFMTFGRIHVKNSSSVSILVTLTKYHQLEFRSRDFQDRPYVNSANRGRSCSSAVHTAAATQTTLPFLPSNYDIPYQILARRSLTRLCVLWDQRKEQHVLV